jgi:hypothetical protein
MTLEEKCIFFKNKGYKYNPKTGIVVNSNGSIVGGNSHGYVQICTHIESKNISIRVHQFAWYIIYNEIPYGEIDHINRIRTDNRICNLRLVNHQQNNFNRGDVKGYCYHKRDNVYQAQIKINKKSIFLGNYKTSDEARNVYLEAKKKYHII